MCSKEYGGELQWYPLCMSFPVSHRRFHKLIVSQGVFYVPYVWQKELRPCFVHACSGEQATSFFLGSESDAVNPLRSMFEQLSRASLRASK